MWQRDGTMRAARATTAERVFAVLGLAYFAKAFAPFAAGFEIGGFSARGAEVGNPVDQITGGAIYLISIALLLRDGDARRAIAASPVLTAFVLLTLMSALWSVVPGVTLRRAVGLFGTASFAAYLACRFRPAEVLNLVAIAFAIVVGLSIFVIVFVPHYGTVDGTEIAGVYGQKNEFGRAMVFACLALAAVSLGQADRTPGWAIAALPAAFVLLLLTRSAQALVGIAAAIIVAVPLLVLCGRFFRKVTVRLAVVLLLLMSLIAWVVNASAEELLDLLGRDATLTDRTLIWELLVEFGNERPWLGRGYGAFWLSDASYWFAERWGALDHSHNGYMDLWLDLGYVGLALFAALMLSASRTAWNDYLTQPTILRMFFPTFIMIAALVNSVGRLIPAHNSIYWVLLCYCAMMQLGPRTSGQVLRFRPMIPRTTPAIRRTPQANSPQWSDR